MDTYTQAPQRVFVDLLAAETASVPIAAQNDADVIRSKENVRRWIGYLPEDCVKTMIEMGWDLTT